MCVYLLPQSIHAPAKRNAGLQVHLRQMVAGLPSTSAPTYQAAAAELLEVANFMEAQRLHGVHILPTPLSLRDYPMLNRARRTHCPHRSCSSATTRRTA